MCISLSPELPLYPNLWNFRGAYIVVFRQVGRRPTRISMRRAMNTQRKRSRHRQRPAQRSVKIWQGNSKRIRVGEDQELYVVYRFPVLTRCCLDFHSAIGFPQKSQQPATAKPTGVHQELRSQLHVGLWHLWKRPESRRRHRWGFVAR